MPGSCEPPVRVSHSHALLLCALFFFLSHGAEAFSPSLNIDEWNKLGQTNVHFGRIGRWGAEIIYEDFFQGDFVPLIQFSAALVFLYLSAWVLTGANRPADTAGVFIVGVSHPFWVDLFNFSFVAASYTLAMLLGLAGMALAIRRDARFSTAGVLAGGLLIGLGLSIYQTLTLFGVVLLVLRLFEVKQSGLKSYLVTVAAGAGAIAIGTGFYLAQNRLYFELKPAASAPSRMQLRSLSGMGDALVNLLPSQALDTLTAVNIGKFATFYSPAIAVFAAVTTVVTLLAFRAQGYRWPVSAGLAGIVLSGAVGLSVVGTSLLIVAPLPPRARPESALALAAVALAAWRSLANARAHGLMPRLQVWRGALVYSGIAVAMAGALSANQLWGFQQRVEDQDRAMAQRIIARHDALVAQHALDPGKPLTVIGPKHLGETRANHFRSIGQSAFWVKWSIRGIFRSLYGKSVRIIPPKDSPTSCPAFPAHGSMSVQNGVVIVCLVDA